MRDESRSANVHHGRGAIHRWRSTLIPTAREAPADAQTASHIWLVRGGYIRQVAAGVYDLLPLAWRSIRKLQEIIRQELDSAGATELLMPSFEPIDFLKQTGRDEAYGDDLFRLEDRHGRGLALAPTHEETIVELMKGALASYKQLPLNLYQIQTKFRDEPRPRSGLLRGREFIMKDAYSFHSSLEGAGGLNETYDAMYEAYSRIFARCGLDFSAVEAESGPIGGSASHEFMVNADSGEDTILRCPESGYAANVEKCEIGERSWSFDGSAVGDLKEHHTPGMPGIDKVAGHLGVTAAGMLKSIVFEPAGGEREDSVEWIVAVVRGDHDVNEGKVRDALAATAGVGKAGIRLADEKRAKAAGFAIGYVSPKFASDPRFRDGSGLCKTRVVVDPDAADGGTAWATGADKPDYHVTGFNWRRDLGSALDDKKLFSVADIRNAVEGDPSPRSPGARLVTQRGIEVGHIFKLGTKYSDAMGLSIMDASQTRTSVIMGCYGIGVTRTFQACVEMSHDDDGIVWPAALAPYHVLIVVMKPEDEQQSKTAEQLATDLSSAGYDVLIDDRSERPGVKFKDADLIGVPIRLTIGDKALAEGAVEFKPRASKEKAELVAIGEVVGRCGVGLGAV